jgi:hypothetical protein
MPAPTDHDRDRLAQVARARRADLGLALTDATAKEAGLSKGTWTRVEKGLPIRETNYVKIDGALHWAAGSCLAVLKGGKPTPVTDVDDPDAPGVQKSPLSREALDSEARDVVQLALIATAKGTSAEEIRDMSERVVRDLRERGLI